MGKPAFYWNYKEVDERTPRNAEILEFAPAGQKPFDKLLFRLTCAIAVVALHIGALAVLASVGSVN